jgi:hypothetical protein
VVFLSFHFCFFHSVFYTSFSLYCLFSCIFNAFTQFGDIENTIYSANRGSRVVNVRASHPVVVCAAWGGSTSYVRGTHGRLRRKAAKNRASRPPTASDGRQPSGFVEKTEAQILKEVSHMGLIHWSHH